MNRIEFSFARPPSTTRTQERFLKQSFHIKFVTLILALLFWTLCVAQLACAEEKDWHYWQTLYNINQANKSSLPEERLQWQTRPIQVKELDVTATLPDYPRVKVSDYRGYRKELCLTCHDGIAEAGPGHPRSFGCTVCHGGDGNATSETEAHSSLIYDPAIKNDRGNPSSLNVVAKSCGQLHCHAGHTNPDKNHIQRVKKSMMGTLAGIFSGLRYQWGGQIEKTARYGVTSIADEDGNIPYTEGALAQLAPLGHFPLRNAPPSSQSSSNPGHIADSLLQEKCTQCHLDSSGSNAHGFRSQGCAACHVEYEADGLYRGDDPTQSRTKRGKPAFHKIKALPPAGVCVQCHQTYALSKNATEISESVTQEETNPAIKPVTSIFRVNTPVKEAGEGKLDIHFQKGFDCIDCHTQFDIMGDGNIYSKQYQAVEIRCETCHGDNKAPALTAPILDPASNAIRLSRHYKNGKNSVGDRMALTAKNQMMSNVKEEDGNIVVYEKKSGRRHIAPQINRNWAHAISGHSKKLECTACHSQWTPQCQGCHTDLDQSLTVPENHLSAFWGPSQFKMKLTPPALMIGPRGKVAPVLPQPPRKATFLDEQGTPLPAINAQGLQSGSYLQWGFSNPESRSGSNLAYAMNPHSVRRQVRSCVDCHLNPQTLGLGDGDFSLGKNPSGREDRMKAMDHTAEIAQQSDHSPAAKVTMKGKILAGTNQPDARPFNQREINRILKVGNCLPCHNQYNDPIFQNMGNSYKFESTIDHQNLRKRILDQAPSTP
jgi:hypothetical protein